MEEMLSSACCRLLSNALAKLAKTDSGTSRSNTCSELSAYQHMLLVDLLVPLSKTRATSELSAYCPRPKDLTVIHTFPLDVQH